MAVVNQAKALGERIRQLRQRRDLSMAQLAELAGLSRQQIWKYETGRDQPHVQSLRRLADALGVTLEALLPTNAPPTSKPSRTASR